MRLLREPNRHDISPSSCIRGEAILGGGGDRDRGRRHILSLNGRIEIPKTKGATVSGTFRYMSGAPFTIHDTNFDTDQNGELFDPLPAGTYSGIARNALQNIEHRGGRNGATGPDYIQLDLRAGWRVRFTEARYTELFFDIFNVTDRAN